VAGVALDAFATGSDSVIAHPFLKVIVVILVSATCYFFSLKYRDDGIHQIVDLDVSKILRRSF
jgi:hypothetical protein